MPHFIIRLKFKFLKNLGLGGNSVISQISRVKIEKMSFHAITRLENFTQWTIRISKDIKTITFHIGNRNSRLKILKNKISLIEKYP